MDLIKILRKLMIFILLIAVPWILNAYYIKEVSTEETKAAKSRLELKELQKIVNEKRIEYEQGVDLGKIEKEMRRQNKMEISKDINFFKIK
ncbi:hypothetical protein [Cetobacterium sp. SF1]|uniref:hypothetical protein n=1 Tax=unclassified Cetobacterium TaxID=2630983 RepID=UPI003CF56D5F